MKIYQTLISWNTIWSIALVQDILSQKIDIVGIDAHRKPARLKIKLGKCHQKNSPYLTTTIWAFLLPYGRLKYEKIKCNLMLQFYLSE